MKLKDIGKLSTGLVTTRKKASIKSEVVRRYKLLSLNAVDENGIIYRDKLEEFESVEELDDQYFTKEGDILVRLNKPFTSIYIDGSNEGIIIPSYFIKIRIEDENFKPEYISWFLNSEKVKRIFLSIQSGTLVPSINQKIVREIDIPIKTIEKQREILELYNLYIKELELMEKLIEERKKQFKGATEKLLKK